MEEPTHLPIAIARLLQTQAVDLGAEINELLRAGKRRITIGLGPGVDVPLLDEELHAAEVAMIDRELIVAALRAEPDGYVVERGWSNFGVYVFTELEPLWVSVPWMGEVRGLRPGDKMALGSTPAEALRFVLPDSPMVPPRIAHRTARQRAAERPEPPAPPPPPQDLRSAPPPTPRQVRPDPRPPDRRTPVPPVRTATPRPASRVAGPAIARPAARSWSGGPRDRYQDPFDSALRHWRYEMVTFGSDERSVIEVDDPELAGLKAAILRKPDQPDRGYELFVKDPSGDLWVQPAGEPPRPLKKGDVVKLRGAGNRLGFGPYHVVLAEPVVVGPRFGPRDTPTPRQIAVVLGLPEHALADADRVRARYRELVRRFHPDRNDGDPGHLSRFLEIQACFDALR